MTTHGENERTPSTRWTWKKVMVRQRPEGPQQPQSPKAAAGQLARRDPREPLTVTIRYRGGAEAWYEIKARGRTFRRPGHLCLHDVMRDIVGGSGWTP